MSEAGRFSWLWQLFRSWPLFLAAAVLSSCSADDSKLQAKVEVTPSALLLDGVAMNEADILKRLEQRRQFSGVETLDVHGKGTISRAFLNQLEKFAKANSINYAFHQDPALIVK